MSKERHFAMLFEYAPISLMEQDFSAIKTTLDRLRAQGVHDLAAYLDQHPEQIDACMAQIKVVKVNLQTLTMYGVQTVDEMLANVDKLFRGEMRLHFRDELLALWEGRSIWSGEGINYTLAGQPIHILLSWRILPGAEETWKQVLVTIEDITARKQAERALQASEDRFRGLFENSPISLWEEDYSEIKAYFDQLRAEGVVDLWDYLDEHPDAVVRCMRMLRVLDVNQKTLSLFGASSVQHLVENLDRVFRDEMQVHFRDQLLHLWQEELTHEAEGINYALTGEPLHVHLYLSVYPGYEKTLKRVLIALEDITARRKAEEYLRYLGTHDVLTGLYNRAFFQEASMSQATQAEMKIQPSAFIRARPRPIFGLELKRLSGGRVYPISIVIADLDDLKVVNDTLGHEAGDNFIRRAAEVLKAGFQPEDIIARIGGDEFAILLPKTNAQMTKERLVRLRSLIRLHNRFYGEPLLSISVGASTTESGENLEQVMHRADDEMYRAKREYHRQTSGKARS